MGNCLPFLRQNHNGTDVDFSRLDNISTDSSRTNSANRRSHTRQGSSSSNGQSGASSSGGSSRRHRNLQASSYVNQLYMNSAFGPGGDESNAAEMKTLDEKRKARIRCLLEQIPIDVFIEGGKGDAECAICMGDFQEGDPIRFLPCMHSYHLQCIDDWLLRSFTCPSCMEPVDSALLSAFTVNTTAAATLTGLAASMAPPPAMPSTATTTKQEQQQRPMFGGGPMSTSSQTTPTNFGGGSSSSKEGTGSDQKGEGDKEERNGSSRGRESGSKMATGDAGSG